MNFIYQKQLESLIHAKKEFQIVLGFREAI